MAAYLRGIFAANGLATLAWIAGTVLIAGLIGVICLIAALMAGANSAASASGIGGSSGIGDLGSADFAQMIGAVLVALGVVFGGGLAIDANVDAGLFAASGQAFLGVIPLGSIALIAAGTVIVARVRMGHDRVLAPTLGAEAARAGIEGGSIALLMTLLTAFAYVGGSAEAGGVEVRIRAGFVFFTLLVAVTASLFLARTTLRRRVLGAADGQWIGALREAGRYLVVQLAAFGGVAVIVLVITCVRAESAAPLFLGIPLLGNLAIAGAALGQFGGLSFGAGSFGTTSITAFDAFDGQGVWLILVALLSIVAAAGVIGVHRQRTASPAWGRVWQMPLIVFGVWCACALGLAGMTMQGEVSSLFSFGGGGSIGLTWPAPFVAGIAAALASIGAEFVPLAVYRMNPSLLAVFGGRRAAHSWLYGAAGAGAGAAGMGAGAAAGAGNGPTPMAAPAPNERPETGHPADPTSTSMALTTPLPQELLDPGASTETAAAGTAPPAAGTVRPAAGIAPVAGLPPAAPMSRKAKVGLIVSLSAVALIVLLAVGTGITVSLLNQSRDPAAKVGEYLALLEQGKAEQATELVDPGLQTDDRELLTDEVMAGAEQLITVEQVKTTSRTDRGARVHAIYSLDGERFEHDFTLDPGPKEFLFLETWELRDPLVIPVTLSSDGAETLLIGQTKLKLQSEEFVGYDSRNAHVYPGLYTVTGETGDYITASTEELRAAASYGLSHVAAQVTTEPGKKLEEAVLKQVQDRITRCVEIPTNMDSECPYITQSKELSEMKVIAQPESLDELTLTRFSAQGGKIAVRENPSSWDKDPELEESTITVQGDIEMVDGKPKISNIWMSPW